MPDLSPPLELAVRLIAEGEDIPAYLCSAVPHSVDDIGNVQLGTGEVSAEGGMFRVDKSGWCNCIAYDVRGQLVTSQTDRMPVWVMVGTTAKVGPIAFGKDGKAHGVS